MLWFKKKTPEPPRGIVLNAHLNFGAGSYFQDLIFVGCIIEGSAGSFMENDDFTRCQFHNCKFIFKDEIIDQDEFTRRFTIPV